MVDSIIQNALLGESIGTIEGIVMIMYKEYKDFEKWKNQKSVIDKLEDIEELQNQNIMKCRKIVKFLLSQEIHLNFPNSKYSLLLHFVMIHGDEATFRILLQEEKNYDLKSYGPEKQTILHHAVYRNKKHCIEPLIDYGIDINIGDHENKTALHYAVRQNDHEMVNYLLSLGADVNKKMDGHGYTAIHYAVAMKNKEMIDILLKSGADITAKFVSRPKRCDGEIYYESSVLNLVCGKSVLREQLSFPGINFPSLFQRDEIDVCDGEGMIFDKEMIEFLLERGAKTEVYDFPNDCNSATPLQRACQVRRLDIVEVLLKYGADPHTQDFLGRTAIFYAVQGGDYRLVDSILMNKKDINVIDAYSSTPLYYCITIVVSSPLLFYRKTNRISMLDYLVDNGADINVMARNGETPFLLAAYYGNPHLIESLLELKADYKVKNPSDNRTLYKRMASKLPSDSSGKLSECMKVFTAYIALTNVDSFDPAYHHPSDSKLRVAVEEYFKKCRLEMTKMKKTRISSREHVTFYQFLIDDLMKVSKYGRSEEIMHILGSSGWIYNFPCYEFLLHKRFERVKQLLFIQKYLLNFFEKNARIKLPILVFDEILSYLSVGDLRNFGRTKGFLKRENDIIYGSY